MSKFTAQNTMTMVAKVKSQNVPKLISYLKEINESVGKHADMPLSDVDGLHFTRSVVVPPLSPSSDISYCVFSTNFDNDLETHLEALLKSCQKGITKLLSFFEDAGGDEKSFIRNHCVDPSVFYVGKPGLNLELIRKQGKLYESLQTIIDNNDHNIRKMTEQKVHDFLRLKVVKSENESMSWALEPPPPMYPTFNGLRRIAHVLFVDAWKKSFAAGIISWILFLPILSFTLAILGVWKTTKFILGDVITRYIVKLLLIIVVFAVLILIIISVLFVPLLLLQYFLTQNSVSFDSGILEFIRSGLEVFFSWIQDFSLYFCVSIVLSWVGGAAYLWLRYDENIADTISDESFNAQSLSLEDSENKIVQNALSSAATMKQRCYSILINDLIFIGVGLLVAFTKTAGYLASIPAIHFAKWFRIDSEQRLVFFSNYDGSWENYLSDFVDKGSVGLTGAWGTCYNFPLVKNLVFGGAKHEKKFKLFARNAQIDTPLWYSAYPYMSNPEILQNYDIHAGLANRGLKGVHLKNWLSHL